MHRFKSAARKAAWEMKDEHSTWNRYNPWVRHGASTKRGGPSESKDALVTHQNGTADTNHFGGEPRPDGALTNGLNEKDTTGLSGDTAATSGVKQRKGLGKFFHKNKDVEAQTDNTDGSKKNKHFTVWGQIRYSIFNSWLNVLLVFAPIGIAVHFVPTINPIAIFVINFIAIIPLAGTLSYATEEIALRVGETLGGLLNATFGNAVELIVSIIALFHDEIVIVQTSLIGSMLSNLLLVMGMCFFFGGINRQQQYFNTTVAQTAASLLALAIAALIIPTAFNRFADNTSTTSDDAALRVRDAEVSRGTAIILLVVYICYLVFQLRTHEHIFSAPSKKVDKQNIFKSKDSKDEGDASKAMLASGNAAASHSQTKQVQNNMANPDADSEGGEEEKEDPTLTLPVAIFTLVWSTVLVAVCAEFLVDAINEVVVSTGISTVFVGLILLPIVGNAAEHATALTVACKDKMDLAIGVAVGSSMQIALLVLPFIVVVGWIAGKTDMTLNFDPFEVIVLFVSVLLVNYLISDGESHWLEGVMLMFLYIIIAVVAWFFPNDVSGISARSLAGK